MQVVQAMTPLLRQSKGRIINTTSASVYITIPMYSAYPTSKAALKILTQHLRMELAPFGIEVTSLERPRWAWTPRWLSWDPKSKHANGRRFPNRYDSSTANISSQVPQR